MILFLKNVYVSNKPARDFYNDLKKEMALDEEYSMLLSKVAHGLLIKYYKNDSTDNLEN